MTETQIINKKLITFDSRLICDIFFQRDYIEKVLEVCEKKLFLMDYFFLFVGNR